MKKYYRILLVMLFLSVGLTPALACPCFNMGFLQTIFTDKIMTQCNIYKEGDIVYKIEIQHNKYLASSSPTECLLNTEFHDIFYNYPPNYQLKHYSCVKAILDACKGLKEYVYVKDE